MDPVIGESWKEVLKEEFGKPYFPALKAFLLEEKKRYRVFPPGGQIFNAFNHTPFDRVKVVLLGQDPYHGAGQAHGLCFSVPPGVPKPPSLINIFKELKQDLGVPEPVTGDLTRWADRGVLLLNAILTVRENQAASHHNRGWENFTDEAIRQLSERQSGLVFLLWGNYAIAKRSLIDESKHLILTTVHPSPLSVTRGFFGCRHFSKTNDYLVRQGLEPIDWSLS
ncbi:MAG TPA: uracil-DNA glycosylase [Bacteroidales bacterium]|nr:uracil-DNA glycosylase [Bacteroidales bacterium]HPS62985.1 uracil-DNA glycosylase [Bacteroidales bacterium]